MVNPRPLLIGISGVAGGGKTTLTKALASHFDNAVAIHFDDYANSETYPADLAQWFATGADFNAFRAPQLAKDLAAIKAGSAFESVVDGTMITPSLRSFVRLL